MSDYPEGPDWWQASDHKWYPPESAPGRVTQPAMPAPGQVPPTPGVPPAPQMPGYPTMQAGPKNNGLAIASMVTSIVSVFCLGVFGIVGAIMGHVALGQVNKSGGTQTGKGMAIAGIVIGWLTFALFLVYIVLVVAVADDSSWTFETY